MENLFKWGKETTQLIIDQYNIKKTKFRDPKIKKKDVWIEIKNAFFEKGYDVSVEALDRKFRNLKKTYTEIKDKHGSTGNGRIRWEHYNSFEEIFTQDKAINSNVTLSSMEDENELFEDVSEVMEVAQNSRVLLNGGNRKRALKDYRQQTLEIENSKLAKMDKLIEDLEKNTKVQEERNNLLRQIIHISSSSMNSDD